MSAQDDVLRVARLRSELAQAESKLRSHGEPLSDPELRTRTDWQARCDSIYAGLGRAAPQPGFDETINPYRRRVLADLARHSPDCKDIPFGSLQKDVLDALEPQIFADAQREARNPTNVTPGTIREIRQKDVSGRETITFHGDMDVWMRDFKSPKRYVRSVMRPDGWRH